MRTSKVVFISLASVIVGSWVASRANINVPGLK